jgi:hypothetical protein
MIPQKGAGSVNQGGDMSNSRVTRLRVFAIESPSALDVLANRTESQTLQAVCKLLGHEFASTLVRSKTEFTTAVKHITSINEDVLPNKRRGRPLCIHLAAHGDKDGLALGSDSASWKYLAEKLCGFSCAMEHYSGPLLLIISACGAEDQKITEHFAEYAKNKPGLRPAEYVVTTVGNDAGEVHWRDAVVAWAIFYHQIGSAVLPNREDIKVILDKIKLVGTGALKYFRWDKDKQKYVSFVSTKDEYKRRKAKTTRRDT